MRPNTGRIPQDWDTHSSKYNDFSSICNIKKHTLSVSGRMGFDWLASQTSVTIAIA